MAASRFKLYVKAGKKEKDIGDCPFSQRVLIFSQFKIPKDKYSVIPLNIRNHSAELLKLNPNGTVPILVDNETGETITDSTEIINYIDQVYPKPDMMSKYNGPGLEAVSGIFGKLAALLKNTDKDHIETLRNDLTEELRKMEEFLKRSNPPSKFLLGDRITELDCQVLPKLLHLQVAGKYFNNYEIPEEFTHVRAYIKNGQETPEWKTTACSDEDIVFGWSRHNIVKFC